MTQARIVLCSIIMWAVLWQGCIEPAGQFSAIPPGPWRATLELSGGQFADAAFDEQSGGKLPFNFNVIYDTPDDFYIEIINGEERIKLENIIFGRDTYLQKDTIRIEFPAYGSYINAKYEEDAIEGFWHAPDRGIDYKIPFKALHGQNRRFTQIDTPQADISGKWAVKFAIETDRPYSAIGSFEQDEKGIVTGTFLTPTGDYRYLDGKMSGNRLFLSTFDGSHAYLFEAKYLEDGTMSGIYRSGNHFKTYWEAERTDSPELPDPFKQAQVKEGAPKLTFSFPNLNGDTISLDDDRYRGKPKLIQIMGTWCPNCRDETEFLVNYRKVNPNMEFEIITLAFERYKTYDTALPGLKRYRDHMGMTNEILYAGSSSKDDATEKVGILDRVISFPTLIFLDRDNNVVSIHSGFNGPATDKYDLFVEQFDEEMRRLTTN